MQKGPLGEPRPALSIGCNLVIQVHSVKEGDSKYLKQAIKSSGTPFQFTIENTGEQLLPFSDITMAYVELGNDRLGYNSLVSIADEFNSIVNREKDYTNNFMVSSVVVDENIIPRYLALNDYEARISIDLRSDLSSDMIEGKIPNSMHVLQTVKNYDGYYILYLGSADTNLGRLNELVDNLGNDFSGIYVTCGVLQVPR